MSTMAYLTRDQAHLVVPWHDALARLVPHARTLEHGGEKFLVMPNNYDETKIARNLGIEVPSPILTRYDWGGGKPWEIQRTTAALLTESHRCYVLSTMGCVDADTEYLAPDGWHRIADYQAGAVAEYRPGTGTIAFVEPTEFVKLPCAEMIRFKTSRGVDQLLSPEHKVLYINQDNLVEVSSAENILNHYDTANSHSLRFITTFQVEGGVPAPLTDAEIRLHVAVSADGYKPYGSKTIVRLKKPRKILRMRRLLEAVGIEYTESPCQPEGVVRFSFNWPIDKGFIGGFNIPQRQLDVVADEAAHWDGSHRKAEGRSFSSFKKEEADFIQFAFAASGCRTSLGCSRRTRREREEVEWRVHASAGRPLAGLIGVNEDGTRRRNAWREPSTDGFKYCFMVPSTFLLLRRNGCIFATGNTGKTRSVLWACDYLMTVGAMKRVLIAAPLSTLTPVWEQELFFVLPHRKVVVLYGSRERRLQLLRQDADFYIINHHGLPMLHAQLAARGFSALVLDEMATFRNKSTNLWKAADAVVNAPTPIRYAWGLTGSPTPNAPTDAWAQVRLLTPARVARTMSQFQDQTMRRVSQFKWSARPDANDTVFKAMQPSVRYTRDDVMELPETSYVDRQVTLDPDAARAYQMLFSKMRMLTSKGDNITAVNEGVLQMKLLQVACGFIYTDKKTVYALDVSSRLRALDEVIDETDRKVIVFVPFVHALQGVATYLRKRHSVALVYGVTSRTVRDKIFQEFQNASDPRIIVAHPQTMSHGLTLTAANVIVWYAPTQSLETYEQANARITRPGQTSKTLIAHLSGTSVERATYARLKAKGKMQGLLLQLFKDQELDL